LSPRVRSAALFGAKATVAAVLIGWLVRSGALDFGALGLFFRQPWLLAMDLAVFAFGTLMGTLRWRALLGLAQVEVPFRRLLQLQMTALFFNVVIPGNVGGDVVKALYVARDADPRKRTTILLLVFVERLVGLAGLVVVASLVTALRGPALWQDPQLRQLALAVAALGALTVLGPIGFMLVMRFAGHRLEALTSGSSRVASLLNRIVMSLRLLSSGPKNLFIALTLSMIVHAAAMGLFTLLTRAILDRDVAYSAVATIFPLGILTMVLPVSPAGLGVGHVAFDRLFAAIGLTSGATIFNVYLLGQITPCLLGVFPYLALKKRGAMPTAAEAEAAGTASPELPPSGTVAPSPEVAPRAEAGET
jgi:uncharacterized protein (TIRG00374 family)